MSTLIQYVVIRGDLMKQMQWPLGAVIAQACHACTAIIHSFHDDANVKEYTSDLDNMHKVVLEANDDSSLRALAGKLAEAKVDYKLWVEQPENFPTCLVTKPYPKTDIQHHFKHFKLLK